MKEKNSIISKSDTLFEYSSNNPYRIAYLGWEFGNKHRFYNYIKGYKASAEATYQLFIEKSKNSEIDFQDTICYPLVFLYRHIVELYLKWLYVSLMNPSNEELKIYIKKGHSLIELWDSIKPEIVALGKRVGYRVDSSAIRHYIISLSNEDSLSMSYRYPIDLKLKVHHEEWKYLDIVNLHDKMNLFFNYFHTIVNNLSGQLINYPLDEQFNERINRILASSEGKITELLEYIDKNKTENKSNEKWLNLSDIPLIEEEEREAEYEYIQTFTEEEKTLLLIFYYTGESLDSFFDPINLAADSAERKKDIYKLLLLQNREVINFDVSSHEKNSTFRSKVFHTLKSKEHISSVMKELKA